jgi:RimJ/RimL family protein N-acetyltransferase
MLKGQKVLLRPVKRSDVRYFLKWFNDPEVTLYLNTSLPRTEMEEEKRIEELGTGRAQNTVILIIEAIEGDSAKPIGRTGLHDINPWYRSAGFSIALGEKDYWSKGYGTEAARLIINYGFDVLNLYRINSSVSGFNERSIRMHKSIGFREEGRQRGNIYKNGEFHDVVIFGLLREEWPGL